MHPCQYGTEEKVARVLPAVVRAVDGVREPLDARRRPVR